MEKRVIQEMEALQLKQHWGFLQMLQFLQLVKFLLQVSFICWNRFNSNVYKDGENDAIRKVFANGTITTIVLHNYVSGPDINGVALTSTGDLFYSTANRIKLLINENSGMCIDNSTCNNHGICEKRRCICDSGWRGNLNCGQFSCNVDIPPRHSSECIGPNQYACIEGWTGVNCTHKCPQGWTGALCEIPICDGIPAGKPKVCNSNGQCISNNTCECNEGFKGQ